MVTKEGWGGSKELTLQTSAPQNGQTHSKQFIGKSQRVVTVCLTILWG